MTGADPRLRLVVLVAPYRRRTEEDRAQRERAKREALARGYVPLFLPDTLGGVLDDERPEQRTQALAVSQAFMRTLAGARNEHGLLAEAVQVGTRTTEGMAGDVVAWEGRGRRVLPGTQHLPPVEW